MDGTYNNYNGYPSDLPPTTSTVQADPPSNNVNPWNNVPVDDVFQAGVNTTYTDQQSDSFYPTTTSSYGSAPQNFANQYHYNNPPPQHPPQHPPQPQYPPYPPQANNFSFNNGYCVIFCGSLDPFFVNLLSTLCSPPSHETMGRIPAFQVAIIPSTLNMQNQVQDSNYLNHPPSNNSNNMSYNSNYLNHPSSNNSNSNNMSYSSQTHFRQ